jgi:hypothetical protein
MTDRELMQMALDMLDDINQCSLPPTGIPLPAEIDHVMEALRARLAQPEPEPVAWRVWNRMGGISFRQSKPDASEYVEFDALYTAPQREWQGLTDEEIAACIQMGESGSLDGFIKPLATYRAIEAKLKEKNT